MSRERNRDTVKVVCMLKPRDARSVTSLMLKRELENVRRELRNLKTGQHQIKRQKNKRNYNGGEHRARANWTCHMCSEVRNASQGAKSVSTSTTEQLRKLHTLTTQQSRTISKVQKSRSWSVLDCPGRRLREQCIAKEQNSKILACFLKVLQTRHGHIPVYCDQEECLREVVHSIAERLGLPTNVPAIEQSQANGRAEQRVRVLKERLQIIFKDKKSVRC